MYTHTYIYIYLYVQLHDARLLALEEVVEYDGILIYSSALFCCILSLYSNILKLI